MVKIKMHRWLISYEFNNHVKPLTEMQQKCNACSWHTDFTLCSIQASLNIALHAHHTLHLMHIAVDWLHLILLYSARPHWTDQMHWFTFPHNEKCCSLIPHRWNGKILFSSTFSTAVSPNYVLTHPHANLPFPTTITWRKANYLAMHKHQYLDISQW